MATTGKGFRYPTSSDTPDIPRDLGYLASDVDSYFNNKQDKITGVSDTEIGYLDGVTSSIQTQLNAKLSSSSAASTYAPIASPTFTGTVVLPSGTSIGDVSNIEIGYLNGVTSAIQTQIDGKATYPSQSGQSGKYLTTDGSTVSWAAVTGGGSTITSTDQLPEGTSNLYFSNERAQDAISTLFSNGTHTGITVTYNDNSNSISLASTATSLPSQTGNAGKYLITDGSVASWATISIPSSATPTVEGTIYGSTGSNFNDKVSIGYESQNSLTTGFRNTSFGYRALYSGTDNTENLAIGYESLFSNVSGQANTAVGYQALYSNTSTASTALGYKSLYSNTTGQNVAIGQNAMFSNTTGSGNTAIGTSALYSNINGGGNVAIGNSSLILFTAGAGNTAIGNSVGGALTTGEYNTFIGREAGRNITTGSRNIVIGYFATASSATVSNEITLGDTNVNKLRLPGMSLEITGKTGSSTTLVTDNGASIANPFFSGNAVRFTSYTRESVDVISSGASGTINIDAYNNAIKYYNANSTADWTFNIRGDGGNAFDLPVGQSATFVVFIKNGSTPYRPTAFQIDGTSITPKWLGGTAPTSGNANSVDIYTLTAVKLTTSTYELFADQAKAA